MGTYNVGDLVQLTATFQDANNDLTDPTTVTFTVRAPNGVGYTPTPTHVSTGVFQVQQSIGSYGTWKWRATGTGAVEASSDGQFQVVQPSF